MLLVLFTAILTTFCSYFIKQVQVQELNVELFLLINLLVWVVFSQILLFITKGVQKGKQVRNTQWINMFSAIYGLLYGFSFYAFTKALEGNLAIVATINSFSILIPIVLSVIFYREHFTWKKWFVIFLSFVSILLFI